MPSNIKAIAVAGGEANALLAGPDGARQKVYLAPPDAGDYQIAFGQSATDSPHFRIASTGMGIWITRDDIGALIESSVRITADVGAVSLVTFISGL